MSFGKREKIIDIEKGKSLYYQYYGSKFGMDRDLGNEYRNCNIPEEIEKEWKIDILSNLENEISNSFGLDLQIAVDRYINLLPAEPEWLMQFLETKEMDTFTAIILCETLKNMIRFLKDKRKLSYIQHFIQKYKVKLLNKPFKIHESYKTDEYLRDYDFSDENIRARIMAI